jgi:hypothetical protein
VQPTIIGSRLKSGCSRLDRRIEQCQEPEQLNEDAEMRARIKPKELELELELELESDDSLQVGNGTGPVILCLFHRRASVG